MAGFGIQVLKADATNSNAMIVSSGLTVTLRINPYSSTTYTLAEVGTTGVYNHNSIDDGMYKLYIGGVEQTQYKTFHIVDSSPRFDTISEWTSAAGVTIDGILLKDSLDGSGIIDKVTAQTKAGVLTLSDIPKMDAIAERTSGSGVTIDGILLKDSLDGSSIVAKTGNQTINGNKTFVDSPITNTITERTAAQGVTIDGILLKDDLDTSAIVTKASVNQTIDGVKTFSGVAKCLTAASGTTELIRWDEAMRLADTQTVTGIKTFSAACLFSSTLGVTGALTTTGQATFNTQVAKYGSSSFAVSNDGDIPHKKYVDDAITSASGNYVESVNEVAVFPELSANIPGVAYADIVSAINSFSSPAVTNQCCVVVKGTGSSSQYIQFNVSGLKDYVHIKGLHRRINIIPDIAVEATTNQNMMFENCSIFLGINTITAARTLANMQLVNCDIYFYNDLTLSGDNFRAKNCNFYSASGHDVTYSGAGEIMGCYFMQNTTASSWTGVWASYDNCNNSYTPPTDPSPTP